MGLNDRIEIGDLVMVWRGCRFCGNVLTLGKTFTVVQVLDVIGAMRCCGRISKERSVLRTQGAQYGWPEYVLKKIKPLHEHESVDTDDEIPA